MSLFPTRQILLEIGPIAIHWYGIMYLLAFLIAWWLLPILATKKGMPLTKDQVASLLFAGIFGTLIGGRLGYVIFYGAEYYGNHPAEIFQVWKGGMASHGGFIGVTFALYYTARKWKSEIDLWQLADIFVVPIALGLALGRMGNFINYELYGPVTDLPWAIAIPGVDGLRHPTPLYAIAKNLLIALVCYVVLMRSKASGVATGTFLVLYGILRFFIEEVRIETAPGFADLTRGQLLTIPIFLAGVYILWKSRKPYV